MSTSLTLPLMENKGATMLTAAKNIKHGMIVNMAKKLMSRNNSK
jgi:hypothetical protein